MRVYRLGIIQIGHSQIELGWKQRSNTVIIHINVMYIFVYMKQKFAPTSGFLDTAQQGFLRARFKTKQ